MSEAGPSTRRAESNKRSREVQNDLDTSDTREVGQVEEEEEEEEDEGGLEGTVEDDDEGQMKRPRQASRKSKQTKSTSGIVYISRLPPGMTPQKVRHLMAKWGDVGKVYAQRRDAKTVAYRLQAPTGYNPNSATQKKQKHQRADFTEAWVEFQSKSVAKTVAQMLNAQMIGGKKGDKWRDDIWTMRYLSGFKWEMLGEQIAYERQSHTARLRNEIARSKTEQGEYLRNVELARVLEKRKQKKAAVDGDTGAAGPSTKSAATVGKEERTSSYRQRQAVDRGKAAEGNGLEGVMGSIFG